MCNVFLFIKTLLAQDIVIKGKVRHANTYQEITKVNIYIKDTSIGTTSDIDGSFTLRIPSPNQEGIVVSSTSPISLLKFPFWKLKIRKFIIFNPESYNFMR